MRIYRLYLFTDCFRFFKINSVAQPLLNFWRMSKTRNPRLKGYPYRVVCLLPPLIQTRLYECILDLLHPNVDDLIWFLL